MASDTIGKAYVHLLPNPVCFSYLHIFTIFKLQPNSFLGMAQKYQAYQTNCHYKNVAKQWNYVTKFHKKHFFRISPVLMNKYVLYLLEHTPLNQHCKINLDIQITDLHGVSFSFIWN